VRIVSVSVEPELIDSEQDSITSRLSLDSFSRELETNVDVFWIRGGTEQRPLIRKEEFVTFYGDPPVNEQ